jgi:hypothetical protein
MERAYFFGDQYVYSDDLNQIEISSADQTIKRTQATLGYSGGLSTGSGSVNKGGVYGSPADYTQAINLKCYTAYPGVGITISSGKALSPTGELIEISGPPTVYINTSGTTYKWTSTPNVTNYVKISYQETSGSIGVDDAGNTYASRYYSSYYITVDGTAPDVSKEILLATFTADSNGRVLSANITDQRLYVRTITPADAVILDPSKKIVSTFTSVEDHVNAKGSGTPTSINPHGLTLSDLGASDGTVGHRLEAHAAGIIDITGEYPAGAFFDSWLPSITSSQPQPHIYISFQNPVLNAAIIAAGNVFTSAITAIDLTDTGYFNAGDVSYWLYVDSTGTLQVTTTNLTNYTIPDKFILCTLLRISGGTEYSGFTDLRKFYSTIQTKIRADLIESTSIATLGNNATLMDNLNRIRYQLGKAINGTTTGWNISSPPLTAGASTYADTYHTHKSTYNVYFNINAGQTVLDSNNPSLCLNRSTLVQAAMQWNVAMQSLVFYANINAGTSYGHSGTWATGSFAALNVGTSSISDKAAGALTIGPSSNADAYHTHPAISSVIPTYSFVNTIPDPAEDTPIQNSSDHAAFINLQVAIIGTGNDLGYYVEISADSSFITELNKIVDVELNGHNSSEAVKNTSGFMIPANWYWRWHLNAGSATASYISVYG